jgi:hypothetical protein
MLFVRLLGMKTHKISLPSPEAVSGKMLMLRGRRVMLDRDLAGLYGVQTRDLNKAVQRNPSRFPEDFMFQLSQKELKDLMFQSGTSSWGGTRKKPFVFTEHGVAMLSSVLRSPRAVQVNIQIMRAFTKFREMISEHKDILRKLHDMERGYNAQLGRHDRQIAEIFEAIRELIMVKTRPKRQIGFTADENQYRQP